MLESHTQTKPGHPPAVDLKGLSLSFLYGHKRELRVLDSVELSVGDGEFVAILGPSGCGKTSMLKVIGGLLHNYKGRVGINGPVLVHGMTPREARQARLFGFVFQNPVLLPWKTVRANVRLPLEILGKNNQRHMGRISSLLELMEIREFEASYPPELSRGMQQRVNLARALVHEPRILLMDEPFGGLDEVTRERLNLVLLKIHRLKKPTVLFVTHSLREAVFLADRIIVLSKRPACIKSCLKSTLPNDRNENIQMQGCFLDLLTQLKEALFQEGNLK